MSEAKTKQLEVEVHALRKEKARLETLLAKALDRAQEVDKLSRGLACKALSLANILAGTDK